MKLCILIGSPKKGKSNTTLVLNKWIEGVRQTKDWEIELHYLYQTKNPDQQRQLVLSADYLMIGFPLYVYSMPSEVMAFFENLEPLCGKLTDKRIGFFVQYGFIEACHARKLEGYLERLCKRLGSEYLGTIIKGGVEGIAIKPPFLTKKLYSAIFEIGQSFGETGQFDKTRVAEFSKPEQLTSYWEMIQRRLFVWMSQHFYWDKILKQNGAYEQRFDKPYAKQD